MLAALPADGAGMGDGGPKRLNPDQQHNSAGVAAQASDHPAGGRPEQGKVRGCLQPPQAATARSCKRVRCENAPSPPPKRARCKAPAAGSMHELAAASAAAAAQESLPRPDEWVGDVPAGCASAERRQESEEAHRLQCRSEAHNARLMCKAGRGPLLGDADTPPAEHRAAGSSWGLPPVALHAGHGVGWAAADDHPAAPTLGSLQARQSTSAGILDPDQSEPEAGVGMEVEYPSEPDAMLSGGVESDIYDLE